eukprot:TRINITY_DN7936_c0_g1_i1.p2 TRINITY_DN7936_c0_g1~~TRINITY_DN7936_c0_g1_i1.p2  ORF type:complete len:279 (+),score=118.09 TRINITY_DN7936_c0_g1_i1:52-888(+)
MTRPAACAALAFATLAQAAEKYDCRSREMWTPEKQQWCDCALEMKGCEIPADKYVEQSCSWWQWWKSADDCESYTLKYFHTLDADNHMAIATRENTPAAIPDSLLGLHFMDGNPLHDELVSFANCKWVPEERSCYMKTYGHRTWSFDAVRQGDFAYKLLRTFKFVYKFEFNEDMKSARAIPVPTVPVVNVDFQVPSLALEFFMYENAEDAAGSWTRNTTYVAGAIQAPEYQFRRIVDENGDKTAHWDGHYKASIGESGWQNTLGWLQFVAVDDDGKQW